MAYLANLNDAKKVVDENNKRGRDYGIYVGESHECVAAVKHFAKAPQTTIWKKGARVKGNNSIRPGTAIATFDSRGKYHGHAAIYINQTARGINVYDQWKGQPLQTRELEFRGWGYVSNDGDQFYVIE
ncbi:BPSL0067 family protein [Snodgrassella alvi]|jgi:hypothetical protein|uniref:BPSL0067 family protein n=1 Tax=Snodgrassella alvi TaxID=1196083 RepID=UPI000C1E108A|nr:BPSL0067 family protein [Snodgrassella alvi]